MAVAEVAFSAFIILDCKGGSGSGNHLHQQHTLFMEGNVAPLTLEGYTPHWDWLNHFLPHCTITGVFHELFPGSQAFQQLLAHNLTFYQVFPCDL